MADVLEDAVQQRGEGGDFAGAEEVEGVGLDERRPVGVVGLEGVEERFLDSGKLGVVSVMVMMKWCAWEC